MKLLQYVQQSVPVLLIFFFLLVGNPVSGQELQPANSIDNTKELHVFILMGQSNMSGYGELLPEDSVPAPNVYSIPTICESGFEWKPAAHPLHNRLPSDRFCLGLPFAQTYLKNHPNVQVGLIPVAWGGAQINKLNKGTDTYNDALAKARFAAKKGVVKGILWHQGESDTVNKERASSYQNKLHQLIRDLRKDLGIPQLPFIAGNLAEFYGTGKGHNAPERVKQIEQVKLVLRNLPEKVENTGFVESTGCFSIDHHNVHFDRKSYIILGERYADKFVHVLENARLQKKN